ncbi:HIT family protein [Paenibacillus sp. CGMCC 1.16610]|uniref:HIT domain-containing protein n=1 Tax=Paenibacillus anseongense TaxID=2682845 RepID=A0ABW9UAG7_9BACL|nr:MULTISPECIES: HIT family protein [Paenibacillus]MBA2937388.1 HIT family protein [Paenibacillus sp. CGMCC 1.16610]MVQ36446.1 HIT domain-containing protein [Paenibacillus anseongense]
MSSICNYCSKNEALNNLMIEIGQLRVSTLYLFKEQTYQGRCIVALNEHETEFFHLSQEKQDAYMRDVAQVAAAIEKAFQPDKINYGAFGDTMPHVHFHIVPKYKDGYTWGKMFEMNPAANLLLTEEQYGALIDQIKSHL